MVQTDPLLGAKLRHARAQEHAADIYALLTRAEQDRHFLWSHKDPQTGEEFLQLPPAANPQDDLRVRIGECVYNLRAALDYAVHVVSGGKRSSQFPLEHSPKGFRSRITGHEFGDTTKKVRPYLKGVGPKQRRIIRKVQPYQGVEWARRLRRISNQDKHCELVIVDAVTSQVITRTIIGVPVPGTRTVYPGDDVFPSEGYEEVEIQGPVQIALPEGTPVRQAIQELETQVGQVLADLASTL